MKTKVRKLAYEKVALIRDMRKKVQKPMRPGLFWRFLITLLAKKDLKETSFTYSEKGMENLDKKQPCLILMNHSCFLDLEIAETIMYPHRPFTIVCTSDGFAGKNFLMRRLGCIPTNKFVTDIVMVRNIKYSLEKLKTSVLMYPEASYSFDGTATPLPESIGKSLKLFNVPVVMIKTQGAFARQPLYNDLKLRKVKVHADVKLLLTKDDIQNKSVTELNEILREEFDFDNWKWQQENNIIINEEYRADKLNRVLYKCPVCQTEGKMTGKGIHLTCSCCNSKWELTEKGFLNPVTSISELPEGYDFTHVPSWFSWQRQKVREEIETGKYRTEVPVDIRMLVDTKAIYEVGQGKLIHNRDGFVLEGCNGQLHYQQKPKASYSLYSDYNWYELGDMVCIGDMKALYYCFPPENVDIAAKCRIATEEIYKMAMMDK